MVYLFLFEYFFPQFAEGAGALVGAGLYTMTFPLILTISFLFAIGFGFIGYVMAKKEKEISSKIIKTLIMMGIIILAIIFSTSIWISTFKKCIPKSCEIDFKEEASCDSAPKELNCLWREEYNTCFNQLGVEAICKNYTNQISCTKQPACKWGFGD